MEEKCTVSRSDQHESSSKEEVESCCIVKMRGLPWSVTADDISAFLSDCQIKGGKDGIHLTMSRFGRPSGEAFVELASPEDEARALEKDRQHMGHRYIEVFQVTRTEMDWVVSRSGLDTDSIMNEGCVRMRGLPFGCTEEMVSSFFSGLQIVPNGINFATDYDGRATGEAYVQFVDKENVEKALKKHMEKIEHRYIEVFTSSLTELKANAGPKMRTSVSGFGRTTPYNLNERFSRSSRFRGSVRRPTPYSRTLRHETAVNWKNFDDDDDSWGTFTSCINPPLSGSIRRTDDSGYGPRHNVHMRGVPFRATEEDIFEFFRPLEPIRIKIIYDEMNRPSGQATVSFASHIDAIEAMNKDKEYIQDRYIDLLLDSVSGYGNQSREGPAIRPLMRSRSRGGAFAGGQIGVRPRFGDSAFGFDSRAGRGSKPFMSSRGTGFGRAF